MENEKKNYEIDAFGNYVEVDKKQITGGSNKPNGQNTNIFIYAIVLLLIIIGVLGIILLNNNSSSAKDDKNSNDEKVTEQTGQVKEEQAKDVVEAYCKAFKNLDVEAIMELLPDEVIKTAKEQDVDLKESLENSFDEVRDGYIEINSITIMDNEKKLTNDEINSASYILTQYGIDKSSIDSASIFELEMSYKEDGEDEVDTTEVTAISINGKWKLLPFSLV